MIHPEQRTLLTDALTPPPECTFDCGIATTYSLDLVTLLTLPLHLAWMGAADGHKVELDPLPVLEALRRTADRLMILCQRGRLQIPRSASPLLGLLEGVVHEASAKHDRGAFHPKVWLLRFTGADESDPPRLRLLVLSRNITDDRSWDISVCLDGVVGRKIISVNRPLCGFLEQACGSSHKPLSAHRRENLARLIHDAGRCQWELPGRFEELRFHALGVGRRPDPWLPKPPAGQWDELGVVSPFVSQGTLQQLSALTARPLFLVSRPEELDNLSLPVTDMFERTWVLDERAESADQEDDVPGWLRGLHAKVYVGKRGWDTHVFLGSANATDAALTTGRNVEFMVELVGKASKVGKPGSWESNEGLLHLLTPYQPFPPPDATTLQEEQQLEELRARLSSAGLHLDCGPVDDGWELHLHGLDEVELGEAIVRVWPVTLHGDRAVALLPGAKLAPLSLGTMAAQDVTSFTAFRVSLDNYEIAFALDLPLKGAPPGRDLEVLKAALRNRDGFVRYLMLLLGDWEPLSATGDGSSKAAAWHVSPQDSVPIFEMLARSFAREPQRLQHVAQLVERLRREFEGEDDAETVLPPEFIAIWGSFEKALAEEAKA